MYPVARVSVPNVVVASWTEFLPAEIVKGDTTSNLLQVHVDHRHSRRMG